jgi:hypothetical protein
MLSLYEKVIKNYFEGDTASMTPLDQLFQKFHGLYFSF